MKNVAMQANSATGISLGTRTVPPEPAEPPVVTMSPPKAATASTAAQTAMIAAVARTGVRCGAVIGPDAMWVLIPVTSLRDVSSVPRSRRDRIGADTDPVAGKPRIGGPGADRG
jgi:hypothetical protein